MVHSSLTQRVGISVRRSRRGRVIVALYTHVLTETGRSGQVGSDAMCCGVVAGAAAGVFGYGYYGFLEDILYDMIPTCVQRN